MDQADNSQAQNTKGHALFAGKDYQKGETVEAYPIKAILDQPTSNSIQISRNEHIDPDLTAKGWCINHSCDPNVKFEPFSRTMVAIKDIIQGDEICFNYLSTEVELVKPFECLCGSSICFKEIKGRKYLSQEQLEILMQQHMWEQ